MCEKQIQAAASTLLFARLMSRPELVHHGLQPFALVGRMASELLDCAQPIFCFIPLAMISDGKKTFFFKTL